MRFARCFREFNISRKAIIFKPLRGKETIELVMAQLRGTTLTKDCVQSNAPSGSAVSKILAHRLLFDKQG
jgi:hypothetical protein